MAEPKFNCMNTKNLWKLGFGSEIIQFFLKFILTNVKKYFLINHHFHFFLKTLFICGL